ncbi:MAG TPA: hypothetical protein V6D48_00855, partial [Oculatellaceae cyanobacterium]
MKNYHWNQPLLAHPLTAPSSTAIMVLSCAQLTEIMKYIVEDILFQQPDSNIKRALESNDIDSPFDLCMLDDEDIADLQYSDDNSDLQHLSKGNVGLLKAFKSFVIHQENIGTPIQDTDWLKISRDHFNQYRISSTYVHKLIPTPVTLSMHSFPSQPDPVRDFQRSIKRDITLFIPFKDDAAWDNWKQSTIAQARTQGVEEVLNPAYIPSTTDEINLFDAKQKYMYAVFEKTLLTDKGKALVRAYQQTYNAQQIYKELQDYAQLSTKASLEASTLLSYITTINIGDGKWRGTAQAFVLHWQDQVRKYHDLTPGQLLSDEMLKTLLQGAVNPLMELRAVKIQADQHKALTGLDLSYTQYCSLVLSAAQQYDLRMNKVPIKTPKRHIYLHETDNMDIDHGEYIDGEYSNDIVDYNIDSPVAYIQVNSTSYKQHNTPRIPYNIWQQLTEDAKRIWDTLPNEAKALILGSKPKLQPTKHSQPFQKFPL